MEIFLHRVGTGTLTIDYLQEGRRDYRRKPNSKLLFKKDLNKELQKQNVKELKTAGEIAQSMIYYYYSPHDLTVYPPVRERFRLL